MTNDQSVSDVRVVIDTEDGTDKEVVVLDPVAGASSPAPSSSGIPSAMTQQAVHAEDTGEANAAPQVKETQMANRTITKHQDTKP